MAMLRSVDMLKARIIVLEQDVDSVTRALGQLGVLHLRSSLDDGGELEPERTEDKLEHCHQLHSRLARLMDNLGLQQQEGLAAGDAPPLSVAQAEKLAATLEEAVAPELEELEQTEQALEDAGSLLEDIEPFRNVRTTLRPLLESDLVEVRPGGAPSGKLEALKQALPPGVLSIPLGRARRDESADLLIVAARRRRFALDTVLQEHGFEEIEVPEWEERSPADVYEKAAEKVRQLEAQQQRLQHRLVEVGDSYREQLVAAMQSVRTQMEVYQAEQQYASTWATAIISGWVPSSRADELRRTVREVAREHCVIELTPPTAEDLQQGRVPSYKPYHRLLAPFQRLVSGYGQATYTELEPTLLFALSFVLLFGIMFGDLGHGLLLVAAGWAIRRRGGASAVRDLGHVAFCAGAASALFGAFFQGSFFGASLAEWGFPLTFGFEPIRLGQHEAGAAYSVIRYLVLALVVGICMLSIGSALNIVNRLRHGDWEHALLDRFGLAGLVFYLGAVGLAAKLLTHGPGAADPWMAGLFIVLPLGALVLREPLRVLLPGSHGREGGGMGVALFEGLIEALETAMTYLANTFSFLRVAAFALSHAALSFTISVLCGLVGGLPGGAVWAALVFVVGTVVLIALEGLIVGIQILRLEYYEFFTKFFSGEGLRYVPFRLCRVSEQPTTIAASKESV